MERKTTELSIAYSQTSGILYTATISSDGTGILISRWRNLFDENGNKLPKYAKPESVATFIDCGDFVSTAVMVEPMHISLMSRTPSSRYECTLPDTMKDKYTNIRILRANTPYDNSLRVHLSDLCMESGTFRKLVITRHDGRSEKVVAHVTVDPNNEITVTTFGYPAGPDVAM